MSEVLNRDKHSSNPTADLLAAIEKLKKFAEQRESSTSNLRIKQKKLSLSSNNPLEKTIDSMRNFFFSPFSETESAKKTDKTLQNEVLQAIDVLKSNYFLIQKLKEGTPEQQNLAASALSIVERYNQVILHSRKNIPTWSHRIARFLYGEEDVEENHMQPLIDFPQPVIEHNEVTTDLNKKISHKLDCPISHAASVKISSFIKQSEIVTANERDGFFMKGITLVRKNHENAFPSLVELMKTIRGTPIESVIKNSPANPLNADHKIVSLRQILNPFPGDKIELTGEFKRESHFSFPVPHSFRLFSKSVQTGFPHPSQHTGWALADQLIPAFPKKTELLLLLQPLLQKKNRIAKALLPKGEFRQKAKTLLKLKKQVFETSKEELLELHLRLNQAIIRSHSNSIPEKLANTVQLFFNGLQQRANAYDELAETQHILLERFIAHPFEKLKSDWIERSVPELLSPDPQIRYQAAFSVLEKEKIQRQQELLAHRETLKTDFEIHAIDFILGMGEVFFAASALIILQHFSEIIHFAPPALGDFEQKVQLCAYMQLSGFLDHIEMAEDLNTPALIKDQLIQEIQRDLEIFTAKSFDEIDNPLIYIVHELEAYFTSQYIAQTLV